VEAAGCPALWSVQPHREGARRGEVGREEGVKRGRREGTASPAHLSDTAL